MKKICFLSFLLIAALFSSCQQEMEEVMIEKSLADQVEASVQDLSLQTRANGQSRMQLFVAPGDRVGVECQGYPTTLEYFTVKTAVGGIGSQKLTIAETPNFKAPNLPHTFYVYYPWASNKIDMKAIEVLPVPQNQTQQGTSKEHVDNMEFYVGDPVTIYPGEPLNIDIHSVYSALEFQINSNIDGLKVTGVDFTAADGASIYFASGTVDVTKKIGEAEFAQTTNKQGAGSTINLGVTGDLNIPNSTTAYASAYMAVAPFAASANPSHIVVHTNEGDFTFDIARIGVPSGIILPIPLRIERTKVTKDIRVLSFYEVGYLGQKDNTRNWDNNYGADGAKGKHTINLRRMLYEHFGKGKTVESGVISFERADEKCCSKKTFDLDLNRYDIIFLNFDTKPSADMAQKLMNWLNGSKHRVLMLGYDWKHYCLSPSSSESEIACLKNTNYMMFRNNHINEIKPHWYNCCIVNRSIGNWGDDRDDMLIPFELNNKTSYFWQTGPFKTSLNSASDQRYWIDDKYWGSAEVQDANVIPLVTYRDARKIKKINEMHKDGAGDGGMVLGVNPERRIVYIGDCELFDSYCLTKEAEKAARITFDKQGNLNNYGKIMGNLWAWMIDEVIQKP